MGIIVVCILTIYNVPPSQWDVDNDGVPDWRDASENPQMGMTAYKRFTLETEPNKDDERYLTLAGYNFRTGQYDPYDTIIPQPDDQRWMIASGPFELMPESSVTVILGVMLTYWDRQHHTIPDTELVLLDHIMQTYYNLNWRLGIQETPTLSPEIHTLSIRPNPVNNQAIAKFSLKEPSYVTLRLYNPLGQLVKGIFEGNKLSGEYNIRIDANGLPSGTYLLVLKSKSGISSRIINVIKTR